MTYYILAGLCLLIGASTTHGLAGPLRHKASHLRLASNLMSKVECGFHSAAHFLMIVAIVISAYNAPNAGNSGMALLAAISGRHRICRHPSSRLGAHSSQPGQHAMAWPPGKQTITVSQSKMAHTLRCRADSEA